MNLSPRSIRSLNSFASVFAVISAPWATSYTSLNPAFNIAVFNWYTFPGNCPTIDGAIIAITFFCSFIDFKISINWLFSWTAPNGQAAIQRPQLIHFSKSILAKPVSSFWIAPTGQAASHGTVVFTIAPYGQAFMHILHFLHFVSSIWDLPSTTVIAPNLQEVWQGLATQPWHKSVTWIWLVTQPLQAACNTVKFLLSISFLSIALFA